MNLTNRKNRSVLALGAALFFLTAAHAGVTVLDEAGLIFSLKSRPPCCVIDARSEVSQREHPLAEAVRFRPGLQIIPTASVIVVADQEKDARRVGAVLAKQHPGKTIFAVKGGVVAWESVLRALANESSSRSSALTTGITFVIPHNTCETGKPLQILQSKPRP